jgi:monofunctional biosynthetic peptidoglycan transglycosylase
MNLKKSFVLLILTLTACSGPRACVPNLAELKTHYPHILYQGPKKTPKVELHTYPPANWSTLSGISKSAQWAVLVSEDWAFYQHHGFDEKQMREAIEDSIKEGKLTRGASTITQQVVRNIYLTKKKTITRKVRELWLATKIERVIGKRRVLELYFNIAEWGEGIFGIKAAAKFYFQKDPSQLTAKEGAFLAMLLPSPKKYSISYRQGLLTPYARKTMRSILGKMVQAKILTVDEKKSAWDQQLSFEKVKSLPIADEGSDSASDPSSEEATTPEDAAENADDIDFEE